MNFNLNVGGIVGAILAAVVLGTLFYLNDFQFHRGLAKLGTLGFILLTGACNWLWATLTSTGSETDPNMPIDRE